MRRALFTGFLLISAFLYAAETRIKGGRMELVDKGAVVVFSDGVRLEQGTDVLNAQEMRTNSSRDKVTATGDVRLLRKASSTETWKGFGEKGFYDTQSGEGYLQGGKKQAYVTKIEMVSSTTSKHIEIWADRIDFSRANQFTRAEGNVHGKSTDSTTPEQYEFFSDQATYNGGTRVLVLTGKKLARVIQAGGKNKRDVYGRTITYYADKNRMVSEGAAEAIVIDNMKGKK